MASTELATSHVMPVYVKVLIRCVCLRFINCIECYVINIVNPKIGLKA